MNLPTEAQTAAAMRHVYTIGATVLAIAAAIAVVPPDQVQPIMDALHKIGDGLQSIVGGVSALIVIVGPIVAGWMAKIAATRASFSSQLQAVTSQAKAAPDDTKQKQMVEAAAALPVVDKIVAPTIAGDARNLKVTPH